MSKFVSIDDFTKGEYKVARKNFEDGGEEYFQEFLDVEEEALLRKLLGHALYDALAAQAVPYPTGGQWDVLVNGGYYTAANEKQYRWAGLKSILVPYLYSIRIGQQYDELTNEGVMESNTENATKISPLQRICRAQAKAARSYGVYRLQTDTLYGFMKSAVYTEAFPSFVYNCEFKPQNIFGL
jgi:hypothetical protein